MPFDLLLGGVRSGKSRFAVQRAMEAVDPVTVVVTAVALDDDMTGRIAAHRLERPTGWATIEEPLDVLGVLDRIDDSDFVLLDCLTVWTSNLMLAEVPVDEVAATAGAVAARLAARPGRAVVVTNEVGMGVHPFTELGRRYRDLLGSVNARFCASADRAALMIAGRLLPLVPTDGWPT